MIQAADCFSIVGAVWHAEEDKSRGDAVLQIGAIATMDLWMLQKQQIKRTLFQFIEN